MSAIKKSLERLKADRDKPKDWERSRPSSFWRQLPRTSPLDESLNHLVRLLENQLPGTRCSILLAKPGRYSQVAASSFGRDIVTALEGWRLEEIPYALGSSGKEREIVFVKDIISASTEGGMREWARMMDLKSCWSAPVVDHSGAFVSLILVFFSEDCHPHLQDRSRLDSIQFNSIQFNSIQFIGNTKIHFKRQRLEVAP